MAVDRLMHDIAQLEYTLFVVNTYAAGIQQNDGRYITKYFPMSPFVIEHMLLKHGSMGCISRDIEQIGLNGYVLTLIVRTK